tara:strand:- start:31 stop:423 length:393 start_codon:yes stop_codon:yes gene_type:complete
MIVYQTDIGGVFIGTTTADQDPLDSNNWLIPAGCLETKPPTITDSQIAKWNGSGWVIKNIPVVEPEPEPEPLSQAETVRAKRDAILMACDWRASSDVTLSSQWRTYRQSLRDISAQSGFPESVTWPTEPS